MINSKLLGIILIIVAFFAQITAEVEPFYVEMMKEGENSYLNGQYSEALKSFKIAEFGLFEEKEYLKELYLFFALSYYKLNKIEDVQKIFSKMEAELGVKDFQLLEIPQNIKKDVEVMLSVTTNKALKDQIEGKSKKSINLINSFEIIFQQNLEYLQKNQFGEVKKGIKKLKKLNKKDSKIFYLKGLLAFRQKRYQGSIVSLKKYYYSKNPRYTEKVVYYLSLASYFVKNYGQCLAFYQKIKDPADQKKMAAIIKKVLNERETMIQEVIKKFNKKDFKKLVKTFAGDSTIGNDVLKKALDYYQYNNPLILKIIKKCQNQPGSINLDFILTSVGYLEKVRQIPAAVKMIEKSKFYLKRDEKNIKLFYQLGLLYYKSQKWDKALKALNIVKKIHPGYNKSEKIINDVKNKKGG